MTDEQGRRLFRPGTFEVDTDPRPGCQECCPGLLPTRAADGTAALFCLSMLAFPAGAPDVKVEAGEIATGYIFASTARHG